MHRNEAFHEVLGHSHHVIKMNDCRGLGQLGEGALEQRQMFVRRFREKLTRKTDNDSCMIDCMNCLYQDSCPILRKYKPLPTRICKKKREEMTDDDELGTIHK